MSSPNITPLNSLKHGKLALLTPSQMRAADHAAMAAGVSGGALMAAAGGAAAAAIGARWGPRPVTVLCGPGNNGGDGFVVARHLAVAGWPVRVALLGAHERLSGEAAQAAAQWDDARKGGLVPFTPACLEGAGLVVDAIFGAGLSRAVEGPAAEMIAALVARGLPICAVDVPSGLDGATGAVLGVAAPAKLTVTFFRKQPGHLLYPGRALCGELLVADIGTPSEVLGAIGPTVWENGPGLWRDAYPWPQPEGHKYTRGEVLVLGGAEVTGASRMVAQAAARAGAGLVTLAAPTEVWPIYATALAGTIVRGFAGVAGWQALLADPRRNAIVLGPGAGVGAATRGLALAALATGRPVVLDADALTSLAQAPDGLFGAIKGPCVLTPHAGEFARLFATTGDKLACARAAARRSGAVVVLKGADTVIAHPDGRAVINANAPPYLATGGSGDVLTGFIAALLAQGMPAFMAAAAAVWLHGAAAAEFGPGLVAQDLPEMLPRVLQRLAR